MIEREDLSRIILVLEKCFGTFSEQTKNLLIFELNKEFLPHLNEWKKNTEIKCGDYFIFSPNPENNISLFYGYCILEETRLGNGVHCSKYIGFSNIPFKNYYTVVGKDFSDTVFRLMTEGEIRWFNSRFENND